MCSLWNLTMFLCSLNHCNWILGIFIKAIWGNVTNYYTVNVWHIVVFVLGSILEMDQKTLLWIHSTLTVRQKQCQYLTCTTSDRNIESAKCVFQIWIKQIVPCHKLISYPNKSDTKVLYMQCQFRYMLNSSCYCNNRYICPHIHSFSDLN